MKITKRMEEIKGIEESWYDFEEKKLSCVLGKCDEEQVKLKVIEKVADLQLQDSISVYDFHVYLHKKTKFGYRKIHTPSGLVVCSNCDELLDQNLIRYYSLCHCCRFEVNARKSLDKIKVVA